MKKKKTKKINISSAIKRPGALSGRAKRAGRSTRAQALRDKKRGTPLQKKQANFYLNVLTGKKKKKRK